MVHIYRLYRLFLRMKRPRKKYVVVYMICLVMFVTTYFNIRLTRLRVYRYHPVYFTKSNENLVKESRNVFLPKLDKPYSGHCKYVNESSERHVMLAVIMRNSTAHIEPMLNSLNKSEHFADIWMFDSSIDEKSKKLLLQWYPCANIVSSATNGTADDVARDIMVGFLSSNYDVLIYINAHMILLPDWWNTLQRCLTRSAGVFSLYQAGWNQYHPEMCDGLLCNQTWLANTGSVWRKKLALQMMQGIAHNQSQFQRQWEIWCKANKIPMQTVHDSVIQIAGTLTTNRNTTLLDTNFRESHDMNRTRGSETVNETCIAALLRLRIYRDDKPELTTFEVEQWVRYMQYAGVNIVYLYDTYQLEEERLEHWVKQIFRPDEVVYHKWYRDPSIEVHESQKSTYKHAATHYQTACEWHLAMDMDEYPIVFYDQQAGFLKRLITKVTSVKSHCSEISFGNFLLSGYPKETPWMIERILRRVPKGNKLHKPLYLAKYIRQIRLHHNSFTKGSSVDMNASVARMNHYWGARQQGWKPDTPESLSKTVPDSSMRYIVDKLKHSTQLVSNRIPSFVTNRFWDF